MVVAAEVKHAVHHGLGHVGGVLAANHDVAQLARPGRVGPSAVDGKREHVGGSVAPAVVAVQRSHLVLIHERDRHMPVPHSDRCQRRPGRTAHIRRLVPVDLQFDAQRRCSERAARSSGACFSEYSL